MSTGSPSLVAPDSQTKDRGTVSQTFAEHLQELRSRLFWSVMFVLAGGVGGYFLREPIQAALMAPLDQPLYYSSPTGGFDFLFKVCVFFGLLAAVPVLTYNILKFFAPALPQKISSAIVKIMLASMVLTVLGGAFAYYVSLPAALHFLSGFSQGNIHSLISTDAYFSFVMVYIAGFAFLFQMPLLMLVFNKINPMGPGSIMKRQRMVILVSFIMAAVLTPTPDPLNQTIMAVPIILLYQISGILVWLANRPKRRRVHTEKVEASNIRQPRLRWKNDLEQAGILARELSTSKPSTPSVSATSSVPAPISVSEKVAPTTRAEKSTPPAKPKSQPPALKTKRYVTQVEKVIDLSQYRQDRRRADYARLRNVVDLRHPGGQAA